MNAITTRRAAFMVPVGLFFGSLVGCQAVGNVVAKLPQWAQDAQTIGAALGTVASVIGTIQGVPAKVIATIQNAVATAQSLAGQLAATASTAGTNVASLVSGFGSAVTSALSGIGGLSVPSWVSTALSAVTTLLPTILQVAGVVMARRMAADDPRAVDAARAYLVTLAR